MEKSIKESLARIRREAVEAIAGLLERSGLQAVRIRDIDGCSSPVIREDPYDGNLSFTLDEIELATDKTRCPEKKTLLFDASSSCENISLLAEALDTDTLVGVAEFLQEREDRIRGLAENEE